LLLAYFLGGGRKIESNVSNLVCPRFVADVI
jgi:hypothetical protein